MLTSMYFFISQPIFHAAPVPPKDFQQSESAANTLTCGYLQSDVGKM